MDMSPGPEFTQGLMLDCINCKVINTEIRQDCQECKGDGFYFQPARMMDRNTSTKHVLSAIYDLVTYAQENKIGFEELISGNFNSLSLEMKSKLKQKIFSIIKDISVYNFDMKFPLIEIYKSLE